MTNCHICDAEIPVDYWGVTQCQCGIAYAFNEGIVPTSDSVKATIARLERELVAQSETLAAEIVKRQKLERELGFIHKRNAVLISNELEIYEKQITELREALTDWSNHPEHTDCGCAACQELTSLANTE